MNEEYDVLTPVTDVTENTEAQPVEKNEEGIELTDTASNEEEKKEVKTYTEEDFEKAVNDRVNSLLPRKIEREKSKIEKKYREEIAKYEETESILKQGFGAKDISDANKKMREFYKEQGIEISEYQRPRYSEDDEKILGKAEATKIIDLGFEEMQDEANRLAAIGVDKMTPREKVIFNTLADELTHQKQIKELAELGVKDDVLKDDNFISFAGQFNSKTPIKTVYDMYTKLNQTTKPKFEKPGSMKSNVQEKVKDYYTDEEISKLTDEDLDDPKVWEAVRKSMTMTRK